MAVIEQGPGDLRTYVASSNVTAVSATVTNGAITYSSGGIRQYCAVVDDSVNTSNPRDVKLATSSGSVMPIGISQDFGQYGAVGPNQPIQVAVRGICKARASGVVNMGDLVYVADSSGRLGTAPAAGVSQSYIVGRAVTAATEADDIFSCELHIGSATQVNA